MSYEAQTTITEDSTRQLSQRERFVNDRLDEAVGAVAVAGNGFGSAFHELANVLAGTPDVDTRTNWHISSHEATFVMPEQTLVEDPSQSMGRMALGDVAVLSNPALHNSAIIDRFTPPQQTYSLN